MKLTLSFLIAHCLLFCLTFTTYAENKPLKRANYQKSITVGYLANKSIKESSGLAASRIYHNVLWTINDGNNKPMIYAVGTDGSDLGAIRILKTRNRDWEDLASFRLKKRPYLIVADIGDNFKNRKKYFLYILREPKLKKRTKNQIINSNWLKRIRFSYEDGPHDCESLAVDVNKKQILLLTKEEPPVLYELKLFIKGKQSVQVARRITEVNSLPKLSMSEILDNPKYGPYQYLTTAMDMSPDGRRAVILTYKNAYLFSREKKEGWFHAFGRSPEIIPIPDLRQAEAICFGFDGQTLFITSEKRPAPLLRLNINPN